MTAPVASPCINVCRMDEASGWCEGCLRTLDEIALWSVLDAEDQRAVLATLPQRRLQRRAFQQSRLAAPPPDAPGD